MSRKYDVKLVDEIRRKQYFEMRNDVNVLVKPIPDCDIPGAMDPRVYEAQRKTARMMRFIPKRFLKTDFTEKGINRLRKPFNNVDSTPFVTGVKETQFVVKADDGYEIPCTKFSSNNVMEHAPVLYFIHGGGFFAGSTDVVAEALRYIVERAGIIAIACDYRLAPEHPYPRGHQDVYQVLTWLYDHVEDMGGDKTNIIVAGDSAGGNLTAYCSNQAISEQKPYVKGQILLYPTVNMGGVDDPYTRFDINDFEISADHQSIVEPGIKMFAEMSGSMGKVLGATDVLNRDLTPYVDVSPQAPETMITCGQHDALLTESLAYARKLVMAGVKTTFTMYCGMGHAYIDQMGNYPQAEDCARDIADFVLRVSGR